jgi:Predicted esterase of the alpha/beta hydrolase fold
VPNIFIIHSYNADTKESFGPYIISKAKELGIDTYVPDFPIKGEADYDKWSKIMDTYLKSGELNEDSIVIAHSLDAHFIPKYLATRGIAISTYISCAGFLNDMPNKPNLQKTIDNFRPSEEEIDIALNLIKHRFSIYSDNDHLNSQQQLEYYADRFNAERVFVSSIGHMGKSSGITELPQAIEIIGQVLVNKKAGRKQ